MPVKWKTFQVEIEFDDRLVGGIPVVPEGADRADQYESWARGQEVVQDPSFEKPLHEALAEDEDMPVAVGVEEIEGLLTGFRRDDTGIYIEARQVKAMLKEAAQRLGIIKVKRGSRQVMQHDLHVRSTRGDQKLRLLREDEVITDPDGRDRRPISVVTRQGPRTAIKTFDYVREGSIVFHVRILEGGVGQGLVGETELLDMLELGGSLGLGADRSQGEGTYHVTSVEEITSTE